MLIISKIKLHNFKRFRELTLDVNPDINILIGDNESGLRCESVHAQQACFVA